MVPRSNLSSDGKRNTETGNNSYRTIINLQDDKITESQKTLSYFGTKGVYAYREFVENAAQKYVIEENEIRTRMGENDLWLPW